MTQENYANFPYMPDNENISYPAPNTNTKSIVEETKKHRALYPEIHYKLKPYITATCDAIHATGMTPTPQDLDNITDDIYDEFCKMHPDMANYMKSDNKENDPPEAVPAFDGFGYRGYGGYSGFRRRGLARDLIGTLLLSELAGRGYPYTYNPYYTYDSYCPYC